MNSRGFTLVEIMVAISILAGLSLLTAQAIKSGANGREQINREILATSEVRDTLRVMERDIGLAFHYRDSYADMLNEIESDKTKPAKPPTPGGDAPPPEPEAPAATTTQPKHKTPPQLTQFKGDPQAVHFTSLSNVRFQLDSKESEQAEVGYFLRSCRGRKQKIGDQGSSSSNCLIRRLTPYIDDDVTQGGNEVVLLEHIKEFKLRYFGPGRDDWVETWKTGKDGDSISKENFPYAVEVAIIVHDDKNPKSQRVAMTMVTPIRFPNNPPKKDPTAGAPTDEKK